VPYAQRCDSSTLDSSPDLRASLDHHALGLLRHLPVNDRLRDLCGQLDRAPALSRGACVHISSLRRAITANLGRLDPCVQVTPIRLSLFRFRT